MYLTISPEECRELSQANVSIRSSGSHVGWVDLEFVADGHAPYVQLTVPMAFALLLVDNMAERLYDASALTLTETDSEAAATEICSRCGDTIIQSPIVDAWIHTTPAENGLRDHRAAFDLKPWEEIDHPPTSPLELVGSGAADGGRS